MKNIIILLLLLSCISTDRKLTNIERDYYTGKDSRATANLRELALESDEKDSFLYLAEYGIALFNNQQYETSIKVLKDAEDIANSIRKSLSGEALAFILSDEQSTYLGESFERVLILQYLALNYMALNDFESAKRYLKKIEYEQSNMRLVEDKYRQNVLARYIDASLSIATERYNDARVQFKNIEILDSTITNVLADRYILALLEQDKKDLSKFATLKESVISVGNIDKYKELTHLVIVLAAGKSAKKESRGKIIRDKRFVSLFRDTANTAMLMGSPNVSAVIQSFGDAENPIPRYRERDYLSGVERDFYINGRIMGRSKVIFDFSKTAIRNYNDEYETVLTKNMASISVKMLVATGASLAIAQAIRASTKDPVAQILADVAVGAVVGTIMGYTIKPDLRCLRLPPANFQVISLWLPKGKYDISVGNNEQEKLDFNFEADGSPLKLKFLRFFSSSIKEI